jgi:hypothetical protein
VLFGLEDEFWDEISPIYGNKPISNNYPDELVGEGHLSSIPLGLPFFGLPNAGTLLITIDFY